MFKINGLYERIMSYRSSEEGVDQNYTRSTKPAIY